MNLSCLIICIYIFILISSFPVSVPSVRVLCKLPALILLMASFFTVVVWPIESSRISFPVISLVSKFLFIEEAVNFYTNLLSSMVSFALKLSFPPSTAFLSKGMLLHIVIFLIWIFTQVYQAVNGNHLILQVIHRHSDSFGVIHLLYSWLVHFWIRHCEFWAHFTLSDWISLDITCLIINLYNWFKEISRFFIFF